MFPFMYIKNNYSKLCIFLLIFKLLAIFLWNISCFSFLRTYLYPLMFLDTYLPSFRCVPLTDIFQTTFHTRWWKKLKNHYESMENILYGIFILVIEISCRIFERKRNYTEFLSPVFCRPQWFFGKRRLFGCLFTSKFSRHSFTVCLYVGEVEQLNTNDLTSELLCLNFHVFSEQSSGQVQSSWVFCRATSVRECPILKFIKW